MTVVERAIAYLRALPPAVSGNHGHAATFEAAQALVIGFQLSQDTALELLWDVFNPLCSPKWSLKELRHKVKSAAEQSKKTPGYLLNAGESRSRESLVEPATHERLDGVSYHNIITEVAQLCGDYTEVPDAMECLDRRCLVIAAAHAGVFALPAREHQGRIIGGLFEKFEVDSLVRAGLLWKDAKGKIEQSRLAYADHRLCIPWRTKDGRIDVLQRRRLGRGDRPYVFPTGHRPAQPFGAERLRSLGPNTAIAFCEGAIDVMAIRLIVRRDGLDVLPLGLPGVDGWRPEWARLAAGRRALVALDADRAGDFAAEKLAIDLLAHRAATVERWRPPAKDWADSLPGVRNSVRSVSGTMAEAS